MSGMKLLGHPAAGTLSLAATLLGACTEHDPGPPPVTVCDEAMSQADFRVFLDGNLVIVGELDEEGSSSAEALGDLVLSLVLSGIDFGNLGSATPSFTDGRYTLTTGDASVGFTLQLVEDFEGFTAGEIIPHNIFVLDSFAQNVEVRVDATVVPPVATVSYDEGPLFGLVDGEIEVSDDLTSASIRLRVRTDLIAIAASSSNRYADVWQPGDTLQFEMATPAVALDDFTGDLEAAGVGFSYTGTHYDDPTTALAQTFDRADFSAVRLEAGTYAWDGTYDSTVEKDDVTLYQSGVASTIQANYTDYFCDASRSQRIGRAEHDESLAGGAFVFEDGTRFPYGLE